jgi:hypothetical protein
MGTNQDSGVEDLAAEILQYLRSHGSAADTAEGIAQWWIKRQRLEESMDQVQLALNYLVDKARIKAKVTHSGSKLYMLADQDRASEEGSNESEAY